LLWLVTSLSLAVPWGADIAAARWPAHMPVVSFAAFRLVTWELGASTAAEGDGFNVSADGIITNLG
jgi:hypothetical protein